MRPLEEKINHLQAFEHIKTLSNTKSYQERINYITRFLDDQQVTKVDEESVLQTISQPSYHIQTLPKKWQKSKKLTAQNIAVVIPGKTEKTSVWVAHNDTTQGFEQLLNLSKKVRRIKTKKTEKLQYGANDNSSGCAILLEDIKNSINQKPENTQIYLFSGLEEGIPGRSMLYGLLGGLSLTLLLNMITAAPVLIAHANMSTKPVMDVLAYSALILPAIPFLLTNHKPFDEFRIGVIGSKHYTDTLDKKLKENINSAIAVDMLAGEEYVIPKSSIGMEPLRWIIPRKSDKNLNSLIKDCVYECGGKFVEHTIGASDHIAFQEKKLPSAALFSNVKNFLTDIHTSEDNYENINLETLAKSCEIIPLIKRRLGGEKKQDMKKKGDLALLLQNKKTKEKYAILTSMERETPLHQLYKLKEENDKYAISDFIEWTTDIGQLKNRLKNEECKLKNLDVKEFVIKQEGKETLYKKPTLQERVKANFTTYFGALQNTFSQYFIPSLIGIYTVADGLAISYANLNFPETLALIPLNLAIGAVAIKEYRNLTKQAYKNTIKGIINKMYLPENKDH